ncbi:MAG: septum formation initiator family protein [Deltaproteobacteria bacterium]|nr:septum formation initiator family protein [Deltaproteobacteria bacterium]
MPPRVKSRPWLGFALLLLLVGFAVFTALGERGVLHLWRLTEENKRLGEKNFRLHRDNEILREKIHRLRHDNRYLEKIAREELGLVRPGEIVYQFASSGSKEKRDDPPKEPPSEPRPSWAQRLRR